MGNKPLPLNPILIGITFTSILLSLIFIFQNIFLNKRLEKAITPTRTATPSPTCRPRPPCLDATPRCLIPETDDMCPRVDQPQVITPVANSIIRSPLTIKGRLPSSWMFEGVFPIKLLDSKSNLILQGQGREVIPGSWQSDAFIEFTAVLTFKTNDTKGFLVLVKDNPSGLPENDASLTIPIFFPSAMEN